MVLIDNQINQIKKKNEKRYKYIHIQIIFNLKGDKILLKD